ncbi:epididymal sperm-binding protein 1-like [Zootoca vivipara]|uniref:epididymal sperm-binding protein 1-like n=1 Tax=Zootoca vivipara TaxID=8524 RepID=UPI00293BC138|nr:epididymal sperm-binding protein 1-like [Zootoca vivipara]
MDDAIRWWCATEVDPDTKEVIESKWKHCETEENGGNDGGRPCVFPFVYKGQTFNTCINKGAKDYWCATTRNYDKDGKWSWCADTKYGGNANGQPCVFPFTYKSWTFYTCSNEDDPLGRFWCATTGDYDKDQKWSYCAETRLSTRPTGPCVFPFIYKGKSYMSCTTDGESKGKLWCSLTSNYDEDQKWIYCTVIFQVGRQ